MNKDFFKNKPTKALKVTESLKSKNSKLISIFLILIFATSFATIFKHLTDDKKTLEIVDVKKDDFSNNENATEEIKENKKQKIDLSFYVEKNGVKTLITSHTCSWAPENVMGIFYAVPSTETSLPLNASFNTLWKEYISAYEDSSARIGYNISFTLKSGEIIDRVILNPDDAYYMFPKVMVFLYDDINLVPSKRYYHITQDDMNENTICSSIKLVGDVETKNISSDITLTAFCYASEDDFDKETGKYIGESYSTITISNISK